jgi:hypothetical protein
MTDHDTTPNHEYNVPEQGARDWHNLLNENIAAFDADIEIRGQGPPDDNGYEPQAGAKYLDTETGLVYLAGDDTWSQAFDLSGGGGGNWQETGDGLLEPADSAISGIDVGDVLTGSIAGGVTGDTPVTSLTGSGLTVSSGSLGLAAQIEVAELSAVGLSGDLTGGKLLSTLAGENLAIENGALNASSGAASNAGRYLAVTDETLDFTGPAEWSDPEEGLPSDANEVNAVGDTVGGGEANVADGTGGTLVGYTTVAGGNENTASGYASTVSGGNDNDATGSQSTIGGGGVNTADGQTATVAGGSGNNLTGDGAGDWSTIGGGDFNNASGNYSTVSGGQENTASGEHSAVPGGQQNEASNPWTQVAGGRNNTASDAGATVGGGRENDASGEDAVVGGGRENDASGDDAVVGGGRDNTASGAGATVAGGTENDARGDHSFAAGRNATADHPGSFVVGDSSGRELAASGPDEARFQMGLYAPAVNQTSTRTAKTDIEPVDPGDVLDGVESLEVSTWEFSGTEGGRHMGPMAEQFHETFGLGDDEETIATVDAEGVALAAVQALSEQLERKENRIEELEDRIETLEAHIDDSE